MNVRILILLLSCFLIAEGCKSDEPSTPPSTVDTASIHYQINALGMRPLRDSEFYILWSSVIAVILQLESLIK